jgi:hypothetical protein
LLTLYFYEEYSTTLIIPFEPSEDTEMSTKFFTSSKTIDRAEFLELYRSVSLITHLLIAPIGIADQEADVLGLEKIIEEYSPIFQQIEDVVAKWVFKNKGYEDDRIVASMHQYIGVEKDKQVSSRILIINHKLTNSCLFQLLDEIKTPREVLLNIFRRPSVTDFQFPLLTRDEEYKQLLQASSAEQLFDQIRGGLKQLQSAIESAKTRPEDVFVNSEIDSRVHSAFGIHISKRLPAPVSLLSPVLLSINAETGAFSIALTDQQRELISSLCDSLTLTISLSKAETLSAGTIAGIVSDKALVQLTPEQANVLLDVSYPVQSDIRALRRGENSELWSTYLHPIAAFLMQVSEQIYVIDQQLHQLMDETSADIAEQKTVLQAKLQRLQQSSEFVIKAWDIYSQCSELIQQSEEFEQAVEMLTEVCLDPLDQDQEGELGHDEEDGAKSKLVVPVYLHVKLLLLR